MTLSRFMCSSRFKIEKRKNDIGKLKKRQKVKIEKRHSVPNGVGKRQVNLGLNSKAKSSSLCPASRSVENYLRNKNFFSILE